MANLDNFSNIQDSLISRESLSLDEKIEEKDKIDVETLIEMGFDTKFIKKVYVFLKPNSVEQAINYMTQDNGLYQHKFLPYYTKKSDKCLICGEIEEEHIESSKRRKNNSKLLSSSINLDINLTNLSTSHENSTPSKEENKEFNYCELCGEEFNDDEYLKTKIPCDHFFCSECWIEYLKEKILTSKVEKIMCMQHKCETILSEEFVLKMIKNDDFLIDKYKKFKKRIEVINNPKMKFCPSPDCNSYAELKNEDEKYVKCENGHQFCFNCLKPWHGKKACEDQIDKDFISWKKKTLVKQCPKCKIWTEKNHGCNHMTCVECQYQWCWLCRGEYSYGHFEPGGPCAGLQFNESLVLQKSCIILYLYKFFVMFGSLLLIWIFWLPLTLGTWIFKKWEDISYDFAPIVALWLGFPFFVCYALFGIEIFTIVAVPCLLYWDLLSIIIEKWVDIMEV